MEKNEIIKVLVEREHYSIGRAKVAAYEASFLSDALKPLFESWLNNASKQEDYISNGVSLLDLMNKTESSYLAALLNMDWIIKEPDIAIPAIESTMAAE